MITEKQYIAIEQRVEELLKVVSNSTSEDDKDFIELDILSSIMEEYEGHHHPIEQPLLQDILRLRMTEHNITQSEMAERINITPGRLSQYLSGKAEPTFQIAKTIAEEFKIDPAIVLGVKLEYLNSA